MCVKLRERRVFCTPFFLIMKKVILILLILSGCSKNLDYKILWDYDTIKDKILITILSNCDKWSIKTQYGESTLIHHENKSGYFVIDRKKDTDSIKSVTVFCNDKKLKEIDFINTKDKTFTTLLFKKVNMSDLSEEEKDLFKTESFYIEFKKIALYDSNYLNNSLNALHLFPIDKEFDLTFEGYLKFKKQEFFEYIINSFHRFFAIPDLEKFINYCLNNEKKENTKILLGQLLKYPVKRTFNLLYPFLVSRNDIRNEVFEFLTKDHQNEFYGVFLESIEKELSQGIKNDYVLSSTKFIFEKMNNEDKKRIFKEIIQKNVYLDLVNEFYSNINIDIDVVQALIANFTNFDENLRIKIFYTSEPFFKTDIEFYLKMIEHLPSKREEILTKIAYDFSDSRLNNYFLEFAKKRPIPEFVFVYLNKLEENEKRIFLQEIFKEPFIQKEVLELIYQYDIDLFKKVSMNILVVDKHPLNEYIIEEIGKTKILPANVLIERFNISPYKEKILLSLIQMGEENNVFITDILTENMSSYPEVLKVFFEKAKDEKVIYLWRLLDKKNKQLLIAGLTGIENRKKPVICDEIMDIIRSEKDRELRLSALWAYVYSCQEQYLKNFEVVKAVGDKELYKEMITAFKDLANLRPDLKEGIKFKISAFLKNEQDEELKQELLLVLESVNNP